MPDCPHDSCFVVGRTNCLLSGQVLQSTALMTNATHTGDGHTQDATGPRGNSYVARQRVLLLTSPLKTFLEVITPASLWFNENFNSSVTTSRLKRVPQYFKGFLSYVLFRSSAIAWHLLKLRVNRIIKYLCFTSGEVCLLLF